MNNVRLPPSGLQPGASTRSTMSLNFSKLFLYKNTLGNECDKMNSFTQTNQASCVLSVTARDVLFQR